MSDAAAATTAAKRRMRRIPEEARKRNAQSCDLCRKRRCKCVLAHTGTGCTTCQEHNVACSYTAPRKTRFYGSVDDLSDKFRCLQAIVSSAFPNDKTDTTTDLLRIGQRLGYEMPDISDKNRPAAKIEDLIRVADSNAASGWDNSANATAPFNRGSWPTSRTHSSNEEEFDVSLVRDTAGKEHYIGPSGTLSFLSQLRKLVDTNPAAASLSSNLDGAARFAQDDTAHALEANEEHEETAKEPRATNTTDNAPMDGPSPGSITSAIARDFTSLPAADMNDLLCQLPPSDALEFLIHSYFKHVHDDFPLFHRAMFEDEYEDFVINARGRLPKTSGAQRPRPLPDWGWIGCLHMMIVFGSISNSSMCGVDHLTLRRKSVTVARTLLPQFISKCTLNNVRILLLLSLFLHNNNERNAAWNLVGTATRISFALGLHRSDMNASFRPLEREVRKRVFCTLYSFEQFLASSLGRPSGLQEVDVEILPPREGFLDGGGGSDAKLVSMSIKLQGILAKTRLMHLPKAVAGRSPAPTAATPSVAEVVTALNDWKRQIGQMPGFDLPHVRLSDAIIPEITGTADIEELKSSLAWKTRAQLRAVLLIHVQYHYVAITATRPILLRDITLLRKANCKEDSSKGHSELSANALLCVQHATQLSLIIVLLDSFNIINGLSGLDIFYAYCAAMVLLLRLLRTRPSSTLPGAQPGATASGGEVREPDQTAEAELQASLRTLVASVQDVIRRTEKSGSMRRFASVVDTFAACVNRPNQLLQTSAGLQSSQQLSTPRQYSQGNMSREREVQGYSAMSGWNGTLPSQLSTTAMQQAADGSVEGLYDNLLGSFFPLTTFGFDPMHDDAYGQMALREDGMIVPDWRNMEYLRSGNYEGFR